MTTAPSGTFLAISDIHFDPFNAGIDKKVAHDLLSKSAADWPGYLDGLALKPTLPGSKHDANWALMKEALDQAVVAEKASGTEFDFIIYPGDFMRHDLWHSRGALHANGITDAKDVRQFLKTMVEVVLHAITDRFPDKPVFVTFGNDDSYYADYDLTSDFLSDLAPAFRAALGSAVDDHGFKDFAGTGCYTATLPGSTSTRLISVANVAFSASSSNSAQATAALSQLKDRLADVPAGSHVWLLMHIPPGDYYYVDQYGNPNQGGNWNPPYNAPFQQVIDEADVTIDFVFNGHTHMDDFRFGTKQQATSQDVVVYKIVPAVSPKFGQNPAFQTYTRTNDVISDWVTHYRTGDATTGSWNESKPASQDYGYTDPAQLLTRFRSMLHGAHPGRDTYGADFKVHRNPLAGSTIDGFIRTAIQLAGKYSTQNVHHHHDAVTIEDAMAEQAVFHGDADPS